MGNTVKIRLRIALIIIKNAYTVFIVRFKKWPPSIGKKHRREHEMNSNSNNNYVGKVFQKSAFGFVTEQFGKTFVEEKAIDIGFPPRPHKFDIVSEDGLTVIECKCYTWTESGNVPSAKMSTLDEAILYMNNIPYTANKIIIMKQSIHPERDITLAEYFVDKKGHLMRDVSVWELADNWDFRIIRDKGY